MGKSFRNVDKEHKGPFIEIKKGDKVALPKKYHDINNLCAVIYDLLVDIHKDPRFKGLYNTKVELNEIPRKHLKGNKGYLTEELIEELRKRGKSKQINLVIKKRFLIAITGDMNNFLFESMYAAKRGKMTVAYALIRKPIEDMLLLLEQMLVDEDAFSESIFNEEKNVIYNHESIDKLNLIKKTISKVRYKYMFSADYIYDLRYNKELDYGFKRLSNQALHIVTNDKNYRTQKGELNFAFSTKDDLNNYYKQYYTLVPYLLMYISFILDEIVFQIITNKKVQNVREFKRIIGSLLYSKYLKLGTEKSRKKISEYIANALPLECPTCNKPIKFEPADYEIFFFYDTILCPECIKNMIQSDEWMNDPILTSFDDEE